MTTLIKPLIISAVLTMTLTACSDDNDSKISHPSFDHEHINVTDLQKHKFEHDFAKTCVARETRNSVNKDIDTKRAEKDCLCIATYMMKDLTGVEAEKFLTEKKNTQSLRIRFENAAYNCLQKTADKPKAPKIFGR